MAKSTTAPNHKGAATEKLEAFGIEEVAAAILFPKSMRQIAEEIGVSQGSLIAWIGANAERSARAREARAQTAQMWDDKATAVIEEAEDQFELSKAKELAHHYRWRASKIAPRDYGDKIAVGGADDLPPIKQLSDDALLAKIAEKLAKAK